MSEDVDKIVQALNEEKELRLKQKEIQTRKINAEYSRMKENESDLERAKSSSFGPLSAEQVSNLQKESSGYIDAAKGCMRFICESFDKIVPLFAKNLILIGGQTGQGKSTCVANIVRTNLGQLNKETGKPKRTLVITNEETAEEVYNRVTCLIKGWHYVNHDQFTEEQKKEFEKWIGILAQDGRLTVIDSNQIEGQTTSVEGIEAIFHNMMRDKDFYDCVIIDYYQEISESKERPDASEFEVQAMVTRVLEKYRKIYPAPIVLLAQVKPPEDTPSPFKVRLEGRKLICNKATMIMEMIADFEHLETEWLIHKSRFGQSQGQSKKTGYDKGRFIKLDEAFKEKVRKANQQKADAEATKGLQHTETKKEEDDGSDD